ncbi:MAG: hypothetical protein IJ489_12130 [Clostridia bacterium]|nr:hypothetical protein [Clostridia bacterium]
MINENRSKRKIIFLDIDGVLNSARYQRIRTETDGNIDETRLPLVKKIMDETGAEIVLSSTWRLHWDQNEENCDRVGKELNDLFTQYGLHIIDKTPVLEHSYLRADEIAEWLKLHEGEYGNFVILDDTFSGWCDLQNHLVKTDFLIGRGLEEKHVQKAIDILNAIDLKPDA